MNTTPVHQTNFQPYGGYAPFKADDESFTPTLTPKVTTPATGETPQAPPNDQHGATDTPSEPSGTRQQESGSNTGNGISQAGLTQEELRVVEQLKQIDTEVRQHEMAHIAAAGGLVRSGANFSYTRGPDGKNYAVAGEVSIDTSPIPGDPQATIQKMQQVRSAALAPASPSGQDVRVASQATATAAKAVSELLALRSEETAEAREVQAFGDRKNASDNYIKVNNLPEGETSTFQLAV